MTTLTTAAPTADSRRYARCIEVSRRVRWEIERDVIRDRRFELQHHFLPEGLSRVGTLGFLSPDERRLLGQVQGRTYANMFGLVERFIGAKMAELGRDHALGDQVAFEAIVRFTDEELKHQALFRRVDELLAQAMPPGYRFLAEPDAVARQVLAAPTWSVLALTCHIELFTQVHYRASIEPDDTLSPLWKDIFLHHWREESQHAVIDELEWRRVDATLDDAQRDAAVLGLIALVEAVDGLVAAQADEDVCWFARIAGRPFTSAQQAVLREAVRAAYRWQYIGSGVTEPRFEAVLAELLSPVQRARIARALEPLMAW